jgi:hypothetical protein
VRGDGAVGRGIGIDGDVDHPDRGAGDPARTLIAAPPAWKFATICAVTSGGNADTPERAAP